MGYNITPSLCSACTAGCGSHGLLDGVPAPSNPCYYSRLTAMHILSNTMSIIQHKIPCSCCARGRACCACSSLEAQGCLMAGCVGHGAQNMRSCAGRHAPHPQPCPVYDHYRTFRPADLCTCSAWQCGGLADGPLCTRGSLLPGPELVQVTRGAVDKRVCMSHHAAVAPTTHALVTGPGVKQRRLLRPC